MLFKANLTLSDVFSTSAVVESLSITRTCSPDRELDCNDAFELDVEIALALFASDKKLSTVNLLSEPPEFSVKQWAYNFRFVGVDAPVDTLMGSDIIDPLLGVGDLLFTFEIVSIGSQISESFDEIRPCTLFIRLVLKSSNKTFRSSWAACFSSSGGIGVITEQPSGPHITLLLLVMEAGGVVDLLPGF